jgi:hypothetical protein
MTLNISSHDDRFIQQPVQVTQNDAVSETDVDDTLLTINVRTIRRPAGYYLVRLLERGTGIDAFVSR